MDSLIQHWLDRAPAFNLDRVHTPIQLTALGDGESVLDEWEPFAVLTMQGKPVELKYIPRAIHNIVTPWERFTSQQGTVDWFRFWLQGHERTLAVLEAQETGSQLSRQYADWKALCALQAKSDPGQLPPCAAPPDSICHRADPASASDHRCDIEGRYDEADP